MPLRACLLNVRRWTVDKFGQMYGQSRHEPQASPFSPTSYCLARIPSGDMWVKVRVWVDTVPVVIYKLTFTLRSRHASHEGSFLRCL